MKRQEQVMQLHTIITCDVCGKESDMDEDGCNVTKNGKDYCSMQCYHVDYPVNNVRGQRAKCHTFYEDAGDI